MHIVAIVHYQLVLVVCCNKNAVILQHWMLTFAKHRSIWVCMCVCQVGDSILSCLCQRDWGKFQCLLGHFIWVQTLHFYFTIPEVQLVGAVLVYQYTGEFLLFSYPYMELWRSLLMFRSFVYRYTRTQPISGRYIAFHYLTPLLRSNIFKIHHGMGS